MQIVTQRVRKGQLVSRRLDVSLSPRVLEITEFAGRKDVTSNYYLTEWPSDFGRGLCLERFETQGEGCYDVNLYGEHSTCDCLEFTAHGHCKHVAALQSLQERGQL
jgi:hypothetical protein